MRRSQRLKNLTIAITVVLQLATASPSAGSNLSIDGIVAIGDSLTAGLSVTAGGTITCAVLDNKILTPTTQGDCRGDGAVNKGGWQPELNQATSTNNYNYGYTGYQTPSILANLNGDLAGQPATHVLIMAGTNDVIRGSVSNAITNLRSMVLQVKSNGQTPIVATVPPLLFSSRSYRNSQILQLNGLIMNLQDEFKDLQIADMYTRLEPDWVQNSSGDNIHISPQGNALIADEWVLAIERDRKRKAGINAIPAIISILLDEEAP